MATKLLIVEVPIKYDRREVEEFEGRHFNNTRELFREMKFADIVCWTLSEFMQNLNDEAYPTETWTTYVYVEQ